MSDPNLIKTAGYLVSTVSVLLLGAISWRSAAENPVMLVCLVAGMAASILGMLLRWTSYQVEKKKTVAKPAHQPR